MNIFLLELQTQDKYIYLGLSRDLVKGVEKADRTSPYPTKLISAFSPKQANKHYSHMRETLAEHNVKGNWYKPSVLTHPLIRNILNQR